MRTMRPRSGTLAAVLALSACTVDLTPVQVGGPTVRLEASGLAGILGVVTQVDPQSDEVIAAGGTEGAPVLVRRLQGVWTETALPSGWAGPVRGLGALPSGETLLVGDERMALGPLSALTLLNLPEPRILTAAAGDGDQGFFVAGEGGAWRVVGGEISALALTDSASSSLDSTLLAVHSDGPDEADFAGDGGLVLHYDGVGLKRQFTASTQPLRALAGKLGQPLYAVGGSTTAVVLRREGGRWQPVRTPELPPLHGAHVDVDGILWVVGEAGTFARFDGVSWTEIRTGVADEILRGVRHNPSGVFLVGGGTILRYGLP